VGVAGEIVPLDNRSNRRTLVPDDQQHGGSDGPGD
jgi:hypothetical protein